jgi:hypothetical protein
MPQGTGSDVGTSLPASGLAHACFATRSSDMTLVKHPFRDDVKAQPNIEF